MLDNMVESAKTKKKFFCKNCGTGFTRNADRIRHEETHEKHRISKKYICSCSRSFSRHDALLVITSFFRLLLNLMQRHQRGCGESRRGKRICKAKDASLA